MIDELTQLSSLHAAGVLTDDEFAAAKAKLLGTRHPRYLNAVSPEKPLPR